MASLIHGYDLETLDLLSDTRRIQWLCLAASGCKMILSYPILYHMPWIWSALKLELHNRGLLLAEAHGEYRRPEQVVTPGALATTRTS
jgi:hypothetical protein